MPSGGHVGAPPVEGLFALSAFAVLAATALASAPPADATLPADTAQPMQAAPVPAPAEPRPATAPPPAAQAPRAQSGTENEIVVSGELKAPPGDPLARANAMSYEVLQSVDDKFVAPVAGAYEKKVPRPARMALRNFVRNVREPVGALAFLLQFKPGKAIETLARFGINTTIGLAGTIDVARSKPFNLPYRQNGLANTLGYYGVGPGPYLFLPIVGPTTVRDLFGLVADRLVVPLGVGAPFNSPYYAIPVNTLDALDYRNTADEDFKRLRNADDPYSSYRRVYLQSRIDQIEALHGRGPLVKGQVGYGPFARPVGAAPGALPAAEQQALDAVPTPAPAPVAETPPAPQTTPPAAPSPVFISEPVVQPIP